jgi:tagatose-1,6-bisphosphate aldolase non-catalytic subunit AgaZ/GatZ
MRCNVTVGIEAAVRYYKTVTIEVDADDEEAAEAQVAEMISAFLERGDRTIDNLIRRTGPGIEQFGGYDGMDVEDMDIWVSKVERSEADGGIGR